MNERIRALREHINALNRAGVRRTTFFDRVAASLERTAGEPTPIRRAKAFEHLLDEAEQVVLPQELLAGSILGCWPLAENLPDYAERQREAVEVIETYRQEKRRGEHPRGAQTALRWALMARDHYNANISYDDLQRLIGEMKQRYADAEDLTPPETGRELERHFNFEYVKKTRETLAELPWAVANHLDLNYPKVVTEGLSGIREEIERRLASAEEPEKRTFYESTRIAVEAAFRFIERYAETLLEESEKPSTTPERAEELREMAAICRKVATARPETFREKLQLMWLVHIMANIGGGSALSFARFDQYMCPSYREDLARGVMSRGEAAELVSCMWLKVNEPHMRTVQSLCLAGTTPEGEDAANELTRLCLEVCADLRQPYPNTAVRVSSNSPEWLLDRVVETMKLGFGQPMVLNDEVWVPNLQWRGYPVEDARDYYNMGCVEIMVQGKCPNWAGGGAVDFPVYLEPVLRNGREDSPGSLETFEQFMEAYLERVTDQVRLAGGNAEDRQKQAAGRYFDPFASALVDDCLERGLDVFQGGARREPIRAIGGYGLGTAADSLMAVKKLVYDEERLTLEEMHEALQADFEGHPELLKMLQEEAPCWGNDNDEVDRIARGVFDAYADAVHALNDGSLPGTFVTSVFSYTHHVYAGEVIGATPNGRRRGEPFSETIGPSQGKDVNGPTALLRSVTKLDSSKITGAAALNVKFSAGLLEGPTGSAALKGLIETYLELGGAQMQVNFVDPDVLRDAQVHPDEHRDLIVRVAGFSEYFTNLDEELQGEIISRTSHAG